MVFKGSYFFPVFTLIWIAILLIYIFPSWNIIEVTILILSTFLIIPYSLFLLLLFGTFHEFGALNNIWVNFKIFRKEIIILKT